ncbi:hypothetical protein OAF54_00220 [bacterium]|nr:hypothetical protein [bacterium]
MTEKNYKHDLVSVLYPGKGAANTFASVNIKDMKGKRYLVEFIDQVNPDEPAAKMYLSKIGGLAGAQIRDLDNYDMVTTFIKRTSQYGDFYVSMPGEDGKCFMLNKAHPDKNFDWLLKKEKEAYVKPEQSDVQAGAPTPQAKPARTFV